MRLCKMLLAVLGATALLGALVGSASARNLSVTETTSTATFARVEFRGGFGTTRCNVTLTQVLHSRTMPKVLESLMGLITDARVGGCEAGSATILTATLPWHVRYAGFLGELPNFEAILTKVVGSAFRIREPLGIECLATSSASSPSTGRFNREAGGRISTAVIGGTVPTTCGRNGTLSGTSNSITPAVTVTLI